MEPVNLNFSSLVDLVRAHFKVFAIVGLLAAILGIVITLPAIMPPQYKSVAVVYPVNIEPYSDESETEQLLQFFESTSVRDTLVAKFDLYHRFDIDPNEKSAKHRLFKEYNKRVLVSKTLYESVRLEIIDEDPEIAKEMADEVLKQVNLKFNRLVNHRGGDRANSYKTQMDYQRFMIDSIENEASQLNMDNRLLEYRSQTRELMREYLDLSSRGNNTPALRNVESWMKDAQKSGNVSIMLENLSYFSTKQYGTISKEYFFWKEQADRNIDYLHVIVSPEVADKAVWPIRWAIWLVSVLSALLFTAVVLAISKRIKAA